MSYLRLEGRLGLKAVKGCCLKGRCALKAGKGCCPKNNLQEKRKMGKAKD